MLYMILQISTICNLVVFVSQLNSFHHPALLSSLVINDHGEHEQQTLDLGRDLNESKISQCVEKHTLLVWA